ncbi:glycosyltransferase family 2 protein [Aeromonas enteropelogenes]|uniref:glycosyltransferase family 2 protein n=1 Tax=Aeromonas enteropelogenes TaxID=29489 RepID=UPI003BA38953
MNNINTPLLSICIPTYNRMSYLERLVNCLAKQIAVINKEKNIVELIIIDNASEDNTEELCDALVKKFSSWLSYYRHEKNIGMDGNFESSFNLAKGNYFWMIGDDDLVCNDGVGVVVNFLNENNNISLVNLKSVFINDENKRKQLIERPIDAISNYKRYMTAYDFIDDVGILITFISGIVVNKKNVSITPELSEKCKGDNLYQLSWIFSALKEQCGYFISVKDPIVIAEPDNSGGYNLFKVFCIGFIRIANCFFTDRKLIIKLKRASLYFIIPFIFKPKLARNFITNDGLKSLDVSYSELLEYKYMIRHILKLKLVRS